MHYDDKDGTSKEQILRNKLKKHENFYLSPADEHMKLNKWPCEIFSKCGISIFKLNGNIKYFWCGAGTSICRMLSKESLLKNNLNQLLTSNCIEDLKDICPNCSHA